MAGVPIAKNAAALDDSIDFAIAGNAQLSTSSAIRNRCSRPVGARQLQSKILMEAHP